MGVTRKTSVKFCIHILLFSRGEEWSDPKNGPGDKEQSYESSGPPGMEPDGIIESNWEEVCVNLYS